MISVRLRYGVGEIFKSAAEPSEKRLNDCAILTDLELPKVLVIFVEGNQCPCRRLGRQCVKCW